MTTVGDAHQRINRRALSSWVRELGWGQLNDQIASRFVERSVPAWQDLTLNPAVEPMIGSPLERLAAHDPSWTALHAIPFGATKDMDHLVIGPGGVFTVIVERHREADVWVKGDTILLDGQKVRWVRSARAQAARVSDLLTRATGQFVAVDALVVPVLTKLPVAVRRPPGKGVHVVVRRGLEPWLLGRPTVLNHRQHSKIFETARRSTTWIE